MTPATMVLEDGSRITTVHLAIAIPPETGAVVLGDTVERVACAPRMPDLTAAGRTAPVIRSDDVRIVTCPLCKMSREYALAMQALRTMKRKSR